ncbi:phage GP46 family protein [Enterobacter kobei]|uniref:phage GP46 family protein n=1 Tax=Enterobacter kobei TaxID=208224 RepID=UPI003CE9F929
MDQTLSPVTGDYTRSRIYSIQNAVYLRLETPLGSYWADPTLGSRLHELRREKDLPRVRLLAVQYARQALQPLLDNGRAESITVDTRDGQKGWLVLLVTVTDGTGEPYTLQHPVRIQ